MIVWQSLRVRLTLWYVLVLASGFVVVLASVGVLLRYSLMADADELLVAQAEAVRQFLKAEAAVSHAEAQEEWLESTRALPPRTGIRISDGSGATLFSTSVLFPAGDAASEQALTTVRAPSGERFRRLITGAKIADRTYLIQIATSLVTVDRLMTRFMELLGVLLPGLLLLACAGGYQLSRRALAPVDALTQRAESLSVANLGERLPPLATRDELARLTDAWNRMLARLESSVTRLQQFTADASHELRTPVALMRTTAELALRRDRSPEAYRAALSQIVTEAERTTALLADLLDVARADADDQALPLTTLDLVPLVESVCRQQQPLAEREDVQLLWSLPEKAGEICGNRAGLERLIAVLLDNARKFSSPGGRINVKVQQQESILMLSVADTGAGIPEEALPHIFERFYRADPARTRASGGYGLGLAIAQWIAQRHGTKIEVRSTPGTGTQFDIAFPVTHHCSA